VWCDVKESWPTDTHPLLSAQEIARAAAATPAKLVVVTGGEPAMHDLSPLTHTILAAGFRTHIETAGVYPLTGQWNWVCFSPKKFKPPHDSLYSVADELKVVVYHPSDLDWAETHAARCRPDIALFLQPEWSKHSTVAPLIVEYVKKNPRWRMCLQTHKFIGIP
jgi:organic radical activating enzyme